jgi:hypothetical protein
MADNPVSWMILTGVVIFLAARWIKNVIAELDRIEKEDRREWLENESRRTYY